MAVLKSTLCATGKYYKRIWIANQWADGYTNTGVAARVPWLNRNARRYAWRIQNEPDQITLVKGACNAGFIVKMAPPDAGKTHDEIIRKLVKPSTGQKLNPGQPGAAIAPDQWDVSKR